MDVASLFWGGMSIWPLVIGLRFGVHGADRILFPATTEIGGSLTYHQVGSIVTSVALLIVVLIMLRLRKDALNDRLPLLLAIGSLAFLTLNTGSVTYHYVLPLGLLIAARGSLPRWAYSASVGILSATTFLAMYAMGAYWLTRHPKWSVGVYDETNPVPQFFRSLAESDWFVTTASLANVLLLLGLVALALWPNAPNRGRYRPERLSAGGVGRKRSPVLSVGSRD